MNSGAVDMIDAQRKQDIVDELMGMLRDGVDSDSALESIAIQYGLEIDEVRAIVREERSEE